MIQEESSGTEPASPMDSNNIVMELQKNPSSSGGPSEILLPIINSSDHIEEMEQQQGNSSALLGLVTDKQEQLQQQIHNSIVTGTNLDSLLEQYVSLHQRATTIQLEKRILELEKEALENQRQHSSALSFAEFRYKEEAFRQVLHILEQEFSCSICNEVYIEPAVVDCGHTFCNSCINQARRANHDCPICRQFNSSASVKHVEMRNFIIKFYALIPMLDVQTGRAQLIRERNSATVATIPPNQLSSPVPEAPPALSQLISSPSRENVTAEFLRNARRNTQVHGAEYTRRLFERITQNQNLRGERDNIMYRPRSAIIADMARRVDAAAARNSTTQPAQPAPISRAHSSTNAYSVSVPPADSWLNTTPLLQPRSETENSELLEQIRMERRELEDWQRRDRIREAIAGAVAAVRSTPTSDTTHDGNRSTVATASRNSAVENSDNITRSLERPTREAGSSASSADPIPSAALFERIHRSISARAARDESRRSTMPPFRTTHRVGSSGTNPVAPRATASSAGASGSTTNATGSGRRTAEINTSTDRIVRPIRRRRYDHDYLGTGDSSPDISQGNCRRFYRRLLDYPRTDRARAISMRHVDSTDEMPSRIRASINPRGTDGDSQNTRTGSAGRERRLTSWLSSDSDSDAESVQVLGSDVDVNLLSD